MGSPKECPQSARARLRLRITLIFEGPTLERDDTRRDYGERRVIAIGLAQGLALTVVYTDRAETGGEVVRRIISARLSNRNERQAYAKALAEEEA